MLGFFVDNLREEEYANVILTDVMAFYIIELEKFSKQAENKSNRNLNFWIKFIKNPEVIKMSNNNKIENVEEINTVDDKSLKETIEAIEKAKEKLKQISDDENEMYLAELREKHIRDQKSIEAYGYDRGTEEEINKLKEGR